LKTRQDGDDDGDGVFMTGKGVGSDSLSREKSAILAENTVLTVIRTIADRPKFYAIERT